jgi:hypothetical protein
MPNCFIAVAMIDTDLYTEANERASLVVTPEVAERGGGIIPELRSSNPGVKESAISR